MRQKLAIWMALAGVLGVTACVHLDALRTSRPLLPIREYERLIVGSLDADYVGTDRCLEKCHAHDSINRDFQHSVHGEQVQPTTGLPLVNCESCHGPGSTAIESFVEEPGREKRCRFESLLDLDSLPAQAQSLLCLKCHSASSTPVLQYWNAGAHANSDVSCFDCHQLHQGPQQKVSRQDMAELCYRCHQGVRAQFGQFSRHPVPEHKMVCTDCHDPHGSTQDHDLKGTTRRETCTRCHMEYQGPFVYEHGDLTENCSHCHSAHGSPNDPLLAASQPFLCLQCHAGHQGSHYPTLTTAAFKGAFYNRCTDCHSAIHGTDIPSAKGRGTFTAR